MQIGIISDTHSYLDERIKHHLANCDEIWHAGDLGTPSLIDEFNKIAPTVGVYGNIDNHEVRLQWLKAQHFIRQGLTVAMLHIAGYPTRYNLEAKKLIAMHKPDLFITGHSHICKVQRCPSNKHLHINPGAAGIHGFHKVRTLVKLQIIEGKIQNLQVVELGLRGAIE